MASVEDYIMLLKQALYEFADSVGDSRIEPRSFSLLCLEFEIPWEAQSKIIGLFEEIAKADYSEMSSKEILSILRERLSTIVPQAVEFSDLTVYSFLRVVSRCYVEELYPISCLIKEDFMPTADLE